MHNYRSVRIKDEYDKRLKKAKTIDIVAYGLGSFYEDYSKDFARLSKQARVRIVAVDPDAPAASQGFSFADARDIEEGQSPGRTRGDVERLVRTIRESEDIDKERLQVRLMSSIPSVNIMRIDDEIFWGPYLLAEQSRNTFTMVVQRSGFLFESLNRHFEQLWEHHTTAPTEPPALETE